MEKRSHILLVDHNQEMRNSLLNELRARGQKVVVPSEDKVENADRSTIFVDLPSDLSLPEPIAAYLTRRTSQAWLVPSESCAPLQVAIHEALVNAIKHGNHSDLAKRVRITATLLDEAATFTVEDEGDGFAVDEIPHPRDPENLYKSSGRGVLLIRSIMDRTQYHSKGNAVTMEIRRANLLKDGQ